MVEEDAFRLVAILPSHRINIINDYITTPPLCVIAALVAALESPAFPPLLTPCGGRRCSQVEGGSFSTSADNATLQRRCPTRIATRQFFDGGYSTTIARVGYV